MSLDGWDWRPNAASVVVVAGYGSAAMSPCGKSVLLNRQALLNHRWRIHALLLWFGSNMQARKGKTRADAGIAIAPILFVIALLGILAAAIAAGSGAFSSSTSTESAKATAEAIVQQGVNIQNAVALLTGRGCSDTQLNFISSSSFSRENPNSPLDKSCNVYAPSGANLIQSTFPQAVDSTTSFTSSTAIPSGMFWPSAHNALSGFGTTANELLVIMYNLKIDVCTQINKIVGYNASGNFAPFNVAEYLYITRDNASTYPNGALVDFSNYYNGELSGCVYSTTYGLLYDYIITLISR
ncbi:MAG: hypothetical protein ACOYL3_26415 [Desulfuromonadaceae bacterium]